jgi:hypothetical protein
LQAGIISSSDVAARAQNYSLLACTSHRCSFHGIHHARVCSIAADRVAAGLASSVCGAVVSHARVNAIKARKRDEDNEQVALLLPCFCCELFPGTDFLCSAQGPLEEPRQVWPLRVWAASTSHAIQFQSFYLLLQFT